MPKNGFDLTNFCQQKVRAWCFRSILREGQYAGPEFRLSRAFFQLVALREKKAGLKVTGIFFYALLFSFPLFYVLFLLNPFSAPFVYY